MVIVRKFFCFELLTAGLVVGWLGLVASISSCVSSILMLENVDIYIDPKKFPDIDPRVLRSIVINLLGAGIAMNIVDLLASGLLIIGTVKRNRLLLVPWLIKSGLGLIFLSVGGILVSVLLFTAETQFDTQGKIALIAFGLFAWAIYAYTWIAIYSLYELVRRGEPNTEYSRLIDTQASGYPVYSRV